MIDPGVMTGHEYKVTFEMDTVTGSLTNGSLLWNVTDATSGSQLLSGYPQGSTYGDPGYPAVDGLTFKVTGPPDNFKKFLVTAHGGGAQDPPLQGSQDWSGWPTSYTGRVNQSNGTGWFVHAGGASSGSYSTYLSRVIRGSKWAYLIPDDFEYRFTYEADNYGMFYWSGHSLIIVPYEIWNVTKNVRLIPYLVLEEGPADGTNPLYDHKWGADSKRPSWIWRK